MLPDELRVLSDEVREACMTLVSAALGRAVGLYHSGPREQPNVRLTSEAWERFEPFCKAVRADPARAQACDADHLRRAREAHLPGQALCRTCHAGVHNFCLPIDMGREQLTLIGGEYQLVEDAALMAEASQNFEAFAQRFALPPEERQRLRALLDAVPPVKPAELALHLKRAQQVFDSYVALQHTLDQLTDNLVRQRRRIAHEFLTLVAPIAEDIEYMRDLARDGARVNRARLEQTLLELSNNATALGDAVMLNLPEYYDLKFNPRPENIERLLKRCINVYRRKAEERRIALRWSFEWHIAERRVEVSAMHLEAALRNLIDNAVKYSFASGPHRSREVWVKGRGLASGYEILVENYGVGIDPDELPHVFEAGFQSRRKQNENVTGAGLGLALVKRYVTQHGGAVEARSECMGAPPERQLPSTPFLTRFWVRLPYQHRALNLSPEETVV